MKVYQGNNPLAIKARDLWARITDSLGERSNNKAATLISAMYGVNHNTLRLYFTRQDFLEKYSLTEYSKILEDFLSKYDTPEKIRNAYLKIIKKIPEGFITLEELAKKTGANKMTIKYYWRKKHPDFFIGNTQGKIVYVDPKILDTPIAQSSVVLSEDEMEARWKEVLVLRDEVLAFFRSPADLCNYIERVSDIKSNSAYVTLFYRRKKGKKSTCRLKNIQKYITILSQIKADRKC